MCVIDVATIKRSLAQLRLRHPRIKIAAPPASTAPSTSAPSSVGEVTLETIMTQLVRMDARLDTLSDELCQVNTRVGRITRRQAVIGGFIVASSPSSEASEDESDNGSGNADDAE